MTKISYIGGFTESELIAGCIACDRKAQKALYSNYSPKMFGICLRYARDYQNAEDILQEGFIKVFKNITKFRSEGSFEGWLRRIFVNTAIEHYRKKVNLYSIVDDDNKTIDIVDDSIFDKLELQDILDMVQDLSPGYRTVFNLFVIEGYSHKEVGELLNVSEGTSKSQLARARSILQSKIIAAGRLPKEGAS